MDFLPRGDDLLKYSASQILYFRNFITTSSRKRKPERPNEDAHKKRKLGGNGRKEKRDGRIGPHQTFLYCNQRFILF